MGTPMIPTTPASYTASAPPLLKIESQWNSSHHVRKHSFRPSPVINVLRHELTEFRLPKDVMYGQTRLFANIQQDQVGSGNLFPLPKIEFQWNSSYHVRKQISFRAGPVILGQEQRAELTEFHSVDVIHAHEL